MTIQYLCLTIDQSCQIWRKLNFFLWRYLHKSAPEEWPILPVFCISSTISMHIAQGGRKSDWVSALSTCSIVIIPSLPTKIEEGNWIDNFVSRKRRFVWSMPIGWVGVQSNSITLVFWCSTFERSLGGPQTPGPQKEFLISTAAHSAPPLIFQTISVLCVNNVLDVYVNVTWLIYKLQKTRYPQ